MNAMAVAIVADSDARQDVYCRESNVCFACGLHKPVGLTLCWPCYRQYREAQERGHLGLCSWLEMKWWLNEGRN